MALWFQQRWWAVSGKTSREGGPEPERPVADREERRVGESALTEAPEHARPGLGALAVAELHGQQLLRPSSRAPMTTSRQLLSCSRPAPR